MTLADFITIEEILLKDLNYHETKSNLEQKVKNFRFSMSFSELAKAFKASRHIEIISKVIFPIKIFELIIFF